MDFEKPWSTRVLKWVRGSGNHVNAKPGSCIKRAHYFLIQPELLLLKPFDEE